MKTILYTAAALVLFSSFTLSPLAHAQAAPPPVREWAFGSPPSSPP